MALLSFAFFLQDPTLCSFVSAALFVISILRQLMANNRLLVKLLPTASLAAADPRANLRPLFDSAPQTSAFGLGAAPAWFLADLPDGAPTPWDLAHSQIASQLGVDESAVMFAEPDLEQSFPDTNEKNPGGGPMLALEESCGS